MTIVKTISSYHTVAGWNDFSFDAPYTWDGSSNLVVEICYDNGSAAAGDVTDKLAAYFDGGTASQGNMFWQNGINCSQSFTSVIYNAFGKKPIIKLVYGVPSTQVQTLVNSSEQEWLGPNSDVYFYDQTNHQLMARIQNLSPFNYGCTQVTHRSSRVQRHFLLEQYTGKLPDGQNLQGSPNYQQFIRQLCHHVILYAGRNQWLANCYWTKYQQHSADQDNKCHLAGNSR